MHYCSYIRGVFDDNEFWDDGDYEDDLGKRRKGATGRQVRREIFEVTGEDGFVYAVKRKAKFFFYQFTNLIYVELLTHLNLSL